MAMWTVCASDEVRAVAMGCARGCYQRAVVAGSENLSGSTLRGRAASYGAHYARSRTNLLRRMRAAGLEVGEARGPHGRRILVLEVAARERPTVVDALRHLPAAEMAREDRLEQLAPAAA